MTADVSALVIALILVAVLAVLTRWIFKPSWPRRGLPVDAADSPDLGMLDVVAVRRSRLEAMRLRATLGDAGIRSSISHRRDGNVDVLVFRDDADRARRLLDAR